MSTGTAPAPPLGQMAPDFTLPSTSGTEFTLAVLRDHSHVVLAFFPAAFTSVCTAELCAFSNDFDRFAGVRATVVGISVDNVPALKEFRAKHGITIDLLSDFRRDVSRLYGVLDEAKLTARRSYFVIDRSGALRWSLIERHNGLRRENAELLRELAKLH